MIPSFTGSSIFRVCFILFSFGESGDIIDYGLFLPHIVSVDV